MNAEHIIQLYRRVKNVFETTSNRSLNKRRVVFTKNYHPIITNYNQ